MLIVLNSNAGPTKLPGLLESNLGFAVVLVVLAIASGRLLGIRVSWLRGFAAAFIGTIAGIAFYYGQTIQTGATPDFLIFLLPALLTTMFVLVVAELASRPGSVTTVPGSLAQLPHPIRAFRRRVSRGRRYVEVLWIVACNGLNPYLRGRAGTTNQSPGQVARLAVSFRRTLEECGGVFVKLGQLLSTRPDLLPESFIAELSRLQDAVPPVPFEELAPTLHSELGASASELFAEFDDNPLAAASIAQVHRATLRGGESVVVKFARPGISQLVERDLDIIQRMARAFAARTAWARGAGVVDLADGFAAAIWEETDFRIEAGNIEAISASASSSEIRMPRVFRDLSGTQVLVMEWLDGVKLRDSHQLLEQLGVDRNELARGLLLCFLRQIMVEGVFHADPHPGNVLILGDGTPALIDFGSVGRLDAPQQSALRQVLAAVDRRDPTQMRDALVELADVQDTRMQELLERALSQLLATRLGPGMKPGAALFTDVLRLLVRFQLSLPPHVAAVFRCLVTLEGTLALLAPGFQVVDESRRVAAELVRESLTANSIQLAARDELLAQLPILRRLPRRMDQLAATIEGGRLTLHVTLFESAQDRSILTVLLGRFILAFLGAMTGIISVLLLGTPGGPLLTPTTSLIHALGYFGLIVSAILMLRAIVTVAA
jgi:ubiquinone biosynthesis protein